MGAYVLFFMPPQDSPLQLLVSPTSENLFYYPVTSIACVTTLGYLFVDLLVQVVLLKDTSPLGKQNIVHHLLTSVIIILCLLSGQDLPKLVNVALLCEVSGFFMHLREIKGKHTWKGVGFTINSVLFFLSFTLVRVLLFPLLIVSHVKCKQVYNFEAMSTFHRASYWVLLISFCSIYALNLFWYYLIWRTALRLLCPSKHQQRDILLEKFYDGGMDEERVSIQEKDKTESQTDESNEIR